MVCIEAQLQTIHHCLVIVTIVMYDASPTSVPVISNFDLRFLYISYRNNRALLGSIPLLYDLMICNALGCDTEAFTQVMFYHYESGENSKPICRQIMRFCNNHAIMISEIFSSTFSPELSAAY